MVSCSDKTELSLHTSCERKKMYACSMRTQAGEEKLMHSVMDLGSYTEEENSPILSLAIR